MGTGIISAGLEIELVIQTDFMNRILFGLLAGMAIGLLMAPATGSETRRRLVKAFDDCMNCLTDESEDVRESGVNLEPEI